MEIRLDKLKYVEKHKLNKYLRKEVEELKLEINRLKELYQDVGIDEITFNDVINVARVVKGVGTSNPFSLLRGLFGFLNRNKIPESKNPLSYPAMYNYQFGKKD